MMIVKGGSPGLHSGAGADRHRMGPLHPPAVGCDEGNLNTAGWNYMKGPHEIKKTQRSGIRFTFVNGKPVILNLVQRVN